jgi:hypothetical protein
VTIFPNPREYANPDTRTSSGRQESRLFSTIFIWEDEKISVKEEFKAMSNCPKQFGSTASEDST